MTHSHLVVNHLLKQIEDRRSRRSRRDVRPEWITDLIEQAANLFEPFEDVARVGYQCQLGENSWELGLYLGVTEVVGGSQDGDARYTNFEFDLRHLLDLFESVEDCRWQAFPEPRGSGDVGTPSLLSLIGKQNGENVQMKIYAMPPQDAGPGMRQFPNGEFEPV